MYVCLAESTVDGQYISQYLSMEYHKIGIGMKINTVKPLFTELFHYPGLTRFPKMWCSCVE